MCGILVGWSFTLLYTLITHRPSHSPKTAEFLDTLYPLIEMAMVVEFAVRVIKRALIRGTSQGLLGYLIITHGYALNNNNKKKRSTSFRFDDLLLVFFFTLRFHEKWPERPEKRNLIPPSLSAHGLESGRKSLKGRLPTPPPSVAMESLWVSLVGNLNLVPCFSSSSSPCHKNRSQRWNGIFLYTLGFSSSSFTFFYLPLYLPVYTPFFFKVLLPLSPSTFYFLLSPFLPSSSLRGLTFLFFIVLYGEEEGPPEKNLHKTRVLSLLYFFFSPWHFQITSAHLSIFFSRLPGTQEN